MTLTTLRLSNGQTATYREAGSGEPLVLIHGVGLQSAAWGPQIAALSHSYRVIALDMPGHGGSTPLPEATTLPGFVNWCHATLSALDIGLVNLAGHSMGALIALGCAVRHPGLVKRVALLNGAYRRSETARKAVIARAAEIRAGKVDLETPLSRWFGNTPAESAAKSRVAAWLGEIDPNGYATAYAAFAQGDATYADHLAQITFPFLALTGDGDPNSTPEMSAAMAAKVQNGTAITIKGHRHMVNLTAPEEVNAQLMAWLKTPVCQKVLP